MTGILSPLGEEYVGSRPRSDEQQEVVNCLHGYLREAEDARRSGENPRDDTWDENIRRYWGRYPMEGKAAWQAKEVLPEFSSFVDRFAAAMKEALIATPDRWFTVVDPAGVNRDLADPIKRMVDVWLSTSGTSPQGHILSYESVFEEQMKLGALMACAQAVIWKESEQRVSIESVDPRKIWLDGTGRNLYRIRRIEMDRHKLFGMAKEMRGKSKKPLYNLDEIERLTSSYLLEEKRRSEELTGYGQEVTSNRQPLILHEFLCDILDSNGMPMAEERSLVVMADEKYVIRGPEKNPFWHGQDWIIYAPLVPVPLSVYGRSYAEDFGSIADTFTKLTNLILDAVAVSSLKVFAIVPDMLADASQLSTGLFPGKMFKLEQGVGAAQEFMHAIDMGGTSGETIQFWQAIKTEMSEAAGINEIGLGQFAPHSRTSATEISETQQSSSALVRSTAQSVEQRLLEPTLDGLWKTGIQHVRKTDRALADAAGPEMFEALMKNRRVLASRPITFQARGISTLIEKSSKLRTLLQLIQIIASNQLLLQQFLQTADMSKLVDLLFDLSNIDMSRITLSDRDRMIQQITQAGQQGMGQLQQGTSAGTNGAAQFAQQMGIQR